MGLLSRIQRHSPKNNNVGQTTGPCKSPPTHVDAMSSCQEHLAPRLQGANGVLRPKQMRLTPLSHEPRHILDATRQFTQRPSWRQKSAAGTFAKLYKKWLGMATPRDVEKFHNLVQDLQAAMVAVDTYFFGGSHNIRPSFRPHKPLNPPLLTLTIQNRIFHHGKSYKGLGAHLFRAGQEEPEGVTCFGNAGETETYIDTHTYGHHTTIKNTFEVLIHEMAHAVYLSFSCDSAGCRSHAQQCHALGPHGHGLLWKEMAEHMRDTIRTWDDDLVDFIDDGHIQWCYNDYLESEGGYGEGS